MAEDPDCSQLEEKKKGGANEPIVGDSPHVDALWSYLAIPCKG